MAIIAYAGKRRNFKESLWAIAAQAWFGQDSTGIDLPPLVLNAGFITGVNAAGTGVVELIGPTAGDLVSLPGGMVIPTAKVATITDADGLNVGGVIIPQYVHLTFSLDAVEAVSRAVFIAPAASQLVGVNISFGVASTSGTFTIEKLTGTTAPGSGTALLTGTLSMAGAANTVAAGTLIATVASLQFAAGNRVGLVFGGNVTNLVGLAVTVRLKRI